MWEDRITVVTAGPVDAGTLASLSAQDYPADLLDVVVTVPSDVADPSPCDLPKPRPEGCRAVAVPAGASPAAAFRAGLAAAAGQVVVWIDRPTVLARDGIAALVRAPLERPDAVRVALARRAPGSPVPPEELADRCADGTVEGLFRRPGPRAGVGPVAFRRERGLAVPVEPFTGYADEVAYRLGLLGASVVTLAGAPAWVLGPEDPVRAAALRGHLPSTDRAPGRTWPVPLAVAAVQAEDDGPTRSCVDRLLAGDVVVHLAGAGPALAAEYADEPRVRLVETLPALAFPSPYLVAVPASLGVGPSTVDDLVVQAVRWGVGRLRVLPAGTSATSPVLELRGAGAGERWESGVDFDVVSLLAPPDAVVAPPAASDAMLVVGPRSLARATFLVGRGVAAQARDRIRLRLGF